MPDEIAVFELGRVYVFKRFFDDSRVFRELSDWYDDGAYRFEVAGDQDLDEVIEILEDHGYAAQVVEDVEPFCVVKPRDEEYGDVLRDAVAHMQRGDWNLFVMRSAAAAEQAELHGATPIAETDLPVPW